MEYSGLRKYIYTDQGDNIGYVDLVQSMGTDLTVVNAARATYDKFKPFSESDSELPEEDKKLIKYLISHKHTSTLEHNIVTFRFKVPLFVAKQHMRHRTWSFNEMSRRHTSENIEFWTPNSYRVPDPKNRQQSLQKENFNPTVLVTHGEYSMYEYSASELQKLHAKDCLERYNALINAGIAREQARALLPEMMYTTYWGTIDLNNLVKFLDLREGGDAQWEISQVAVAVHEFADMVWPETMKNYKTPDQRKIEEQSLFEQRVQKEVEKRLNQELLNQNLINQIKG